MSDRDWWYSREELSDRFSFEVLELDYECYGSSTWKRELKKAGIQADNCFYFQNEALIRVIKPV